MAEGRPIRADLCVIGAGSGGLMVAAGAAQMGARVVLVERAKMGGECLNTGCVPSKALIQAAAVAQSMRTAHRFGLAAVEPQVDYAAVMESVQRVIATLAPHDSAQRFEGLGVRVLRGSARFVGPDAVEVDGGRVEARRFVVATGSRPHIPPVPGLADVPYFTTDSLWENRTRPDHLIVVGGGPVGMELAQAHRRLGSEVSVVEMLSVLGHEDPDLVAVVRQSLTREGVAILEGAEVRQVARHGDALAVTVAHIDGVDVLTGSHLLIAAGRRPNVEDLDLDRAGVAWSPAGVTVDARLRTTNRRIYAVGDVTGGPRFTHAAGYQAGVVLRNALFRLPGRAAAILPRVVYTDPELAQAGLTEAEARARHGAVRVLRWDFKDNDRAQTERRTEGFVKFVTTRRGRLLGVSIVGREAGETIQPYHLALARGLGLAALATLVVPYPTRGEVGKRAAGAWFADKLFGPWSRRIVRLLARLG